MTTNIDDNTASAQAEPNEASDNIPFAWRHPLVMPGRKKVSKVLKTIAAGESERAAALVATGNPDE
ncbi:MAG: hypothetical protein FWD58_07075 [Firmicutes bacterium]|nr:hypothetical protein [Bacillota bacterium]